MIEINIIPQSEDWREGELIIDSNIVQAASKCDHLVIDIKRHKIWVDSMIELMKKMEESAVNIINTNHEDRDQLLHELVESIRKIRTELHR